MKNIIIFVTCFLLAIECVLAQEYFSFAKKNIIAEQPVDKQANAATREFYSFLRNEVWGKKGLGGLPGGVEL